MTCIIGYTHNGNAYVGADSGEQVAYGAMLALTTKNPRAKIIRALELAASAVGSVGGEMTVMKVPK